MSDTKFTKGVWSTEVGCSQAFITTGNKFIHESNVDISLGCREERIANAHLIAAAPEMYDMLKSLSEMMPMLDEQTHPQIEMDSVKYDIDNLLAKARGES